MSIAEDYKGEVTAQVATGHPACQRRFCAGPSLEQVPHASGSR